MELNKYIIDTVVRAETGVKMVSYVVLASSAKDALDRFMEDENVGTVSYESEIETDSIIIGVQKLEDGTT